MADASAGAAITPAVGALFGGFQDIAIGNAHILLLDNNGRVWAWRNPNDPNGLLSRYWDSVGVTGYTGGAVKVTPNWGDAVIVQIGAMEQASLALASDGTVWQWGHYEYNGFGSITPIKVSGWGTRKITSIASGRRHYLALADDGTVWAWGIGSEGQLGTSDSTDTPVQVSGIPAVSKIFAGGDSSFAISPLYGLIAWGANDKGQLGTGTTSSRQAPTQVASPQGAAPYYANYVKIATDCQSTIGLLDNGSAYVFGSNSAGQLGDGTNVDRVAPTRVGKFAGSAVGDVWMSGCTSFAWNLGTTTAPDNMLYGSGDNTGGQLGDGYAGASASRQNFTQVRPAPAGTLWGATNQIAKLTGNATHQCSGAIAQDGTVWLWGACYSTGNNKQPTEYVPFRLTVPTSFTSRVGEQTYPLVETRAESNWSGILQELRLTGLPAGVNCLQGYGYRDGKMAFWVICSGSPSTAGTYPVSVNFLVGDTSIGSKSFVWTVTPQPQYTLTVVNGSGSGNYAEGASVQVTAGAPEPRMTFDKWVSADGGSFTDENSTRTNYTMPGHNATVTATYKAAATTYRLSVINGTLEDGSTSGNFASGECPKIIANTPEPGMAFDYWSVPSSILVNGTFVDSSKPTTQFCMPLRAQTVTANYKERGELPVTGTLTYTANFPRMGYYPATPTGGGAKVQSIAGWGDPDPNEIAWVVTKADGTEWRPSALTLIPVSVEYYGATVHAEYNGQRTNQVPLKAVPSFQATQTWAGPGSPLVAGATFTMVPFEFSYDVQWHLGDYRNPVLYRVSGNARAPIDKLDPQGFASGFTLEEALGAPISWQSTGAAGPYIVTVTINASSGIMSADWYSRTVNSPYVNYAPGSSEEVTFGTVTVWPDGFIKTVAVGEPVTITAAPPAGKVFERWVPDGITFADPTQTSITFTMPSNNVSIFTQYRDYCTVPFPDVVDGSQFSCDIAWMVSSNITKGYADGTFGPGKNITRESTAAFMYRHAGSPPHTLPAKHTFPDVPHGTDVTPNTFHLEIEWLAHKGITTGYADGTFGPGKNVTRESMAVYLYRAAGSPAFVPPVTPTFNDVPNDPNKAEFYKAIEWLAATGVASGYKDGGFHPGASITRESMAAFLHRATDKYLLTY